MALKRSTVRLRYAPVFARSGGGDGKAAKGSTSAGRAYPLNGNQGNRNLAFSFSPIFCDTTPQIKSPMPVEGQDLAVACARAAEEILAEDIKILDLQGISSLTDFMVICSGNSMPHLKAILREVEAKVHGFTEAKPLYTEGRADSRWVVLDYVDVMVHIMHGEMRKLYALEDLWGDASMIQWES